MWLEIYAVLVSLCAIKAILGFHFPWEKCPCCGKKYPDCKSDKNFINYCKDEFENGVK